MTDVLALSWRAYPAAIVVLLGAGLAVAGLAAEIRPGRPRWSGPEGALAYLHLFRRVVVGLALVVGGVAWSWQVPWLVAVCLCVGVGELLESSYYIGMLRRGQRRGALRPSAGEARSAGPRA